MTTKPPAPPILITEAYSGIASKAPRVAIFPKWVKGLVTGIDHSKTTIYYPLGDRRAFLADMPIEEVIATLWPIDA